MIRDQITPGRTISNENFHNGDINIKWTTSGRRWWIPSRSYLRMRVRYTKGDGTAIKLADNLAPSMGTMANLFQSASFELNGTSISKIPNFLAQIDALHNRKSKSKSWMESVGASTNFYQGNVADRQAQLAADGLTPDIGRKNLDKEGLGFTATRTVAYDEAKAEITFDGAANPAESYVIGDTFYLTRNGKTTTHTVLTRTSTVLTITPKLGADINPAEDLPFGRVRSEQSSAARQTGVVELIWQPPLSIFKIDHAIPTGEFNLVLTPFSKTEFQRRAYESLGGDRGIGTGATDIKFEVENLFLYVQTITGPRADNVTYMLDLQETQCQVDPVSSVSTLKGFTVSPSTFGLTAAFQDSRAGFRTDVPASKFRVNPHGGSDVKQELNLRNFYISYAGENKPKPNANPEHKLAEGTVSGIDFTTQMYVDTLLDTGSYFDCGGSESLQEWQDNGAYYDFAWPRDGGGGIADRAEVYYSFSSTPQDTRLLFFNHYRRVAQIEIKNSRVQKVRVADA